MKIPKYQMIKNELQAQIESGKFDNGDHFYTEAELAKMYNVSSITVIRAIKELTKDGYLVRYQGKGTFVSRLRKRKLVEFSDIEVFNIEHDDVTVTYFEKENDPKYLEKLGLGKKDFYYCIKRLRRTDGLPYQYHTSYIPAKYINPDVKPSYYNSIYNRYREDFGLYLTEEISTETNEIKFPAPPEIAEKFELTEKEPLVLMIKRTKLRTTGEYVEYAETYKRWDFYKIEFSTIEENL